MIAALRGEQKELTSGSLRKALFYLAVPMIAELIIEGCFAVVDILCLSKVSQDAVSVVGITEFVMFIVYSIAMGLGMGTTAMVARRIGEKDVEEARIAASQSLILGFIAAVSIALIGLFFSDDILGLFTDETRLIEYGDIYIKIMFLTNFVIVFLFLFNSIFRATGEAKYAMYALGLSSILNIILDIVLIFGYGPFPELGLKGAAVATSIGRGIGVALQLYIFWKGASVIRYRIQYFKVRLQVMRRLIGISLGGILQFAIESFSWIFLAKLMVDFGSETRTGYFIAFRVIVFSIIPAFGIANAAATLIGQNLGARQVDRAASSVWLAARYSAYYLVLITIIYLISASYLMSLFMDDPLVIQHGSLALRVICLGNIFFAYAMVIGQSFNGAGDTWTPTLWNLIIFWILQIPLAWLLSRWLGPLGVYITICICNALLALIFVLIFRQRKWAQITV